MQPQMISADAQLEVVLFILCLNCNNDYVVPNRWQMDLKDMPKTFLTRPTDLPPKVADNQFMIIVLPEVNFADNPSVNPLGSIPWALEHLCVDIRDHLS